MMARALLWALLLCVAALPPQASAAREARRVPVEQQATPPDLEQYEAWVREAYSAARRNDRLGLEQVTPQLLATREVVLPGGERVPVDNAWLEAALAGPEPDLTVVAARLGALIDALAQPGQTAGDGALDALRDILGRPPFADEAAREPTWLERLFEWLANLLDQIFGPVVSGTAPGSRALGWGLLALGTLAVLGVVIYALLSLRRGIVRSASTADDDPEAGLTATTALQQASEIARSGDYRSAVRYLYLSLLLRLDERGLLRYDRTLTNREYLAQVRPNAELHRRLVPVVETFDRVWYGHDPLDMAGFDAYRREIDEVSRSAATRRAEPAETTR
jgi:hypothetical protein